MEGLAARITRVFALALKLPEDFVASFIDGAGERAVAPSVTAALLSRAKPGQILAPAAHTHDGSLTILLLQAGSRGLEISMWMVKWVEVPPRPGAFRQHRRSHGALDQRPLDLDAAPRRDPGGRRRGAAPVLRLLDYRTGTPILWRSTPAFRPARLISACPLGAVSWASSSRRRPISPLADLCPFGLALAFPLGLPYMPRHSTGGFYAVLIEGVAPVA